MKALNRSEDVNEVPTIITERLVLRPFTEQDADPLYEILAVEGVMRYFPNPGPMSRDRVERFVAYQIKHWQDHGYGSLDPFGGIVVDGRLPGITVQHPGLAGGIFRSYSGLQVVEGLV